MLTHSLTKRSNWLRIQYCKVFCSRYISDDKEPPSLHAYSKQTIPSLPNIHNELIKRAPERVQGSRILQVAILGVPNAGKSTLVNQLSGWQTCTVSKKVHTTKKTSRSVLVRNETQIVFLDTPGLVLPSEVKQHNLESSFLIDPEKALAQANLLLVLHDVSNKWTRGSLSPKILRLLHLYPDKESILVLNKTDLLKEKRLLLALTSKLSEGIIGGQSLDSPPPNLCQKEFKQKFHETDAAIDQKDSHNSFQNLSEKEVAKRIEGKTGWSNFSRVFMISALDGDGVVDIADYLYQSARPGRWIYNSSIVTDQNPHQIAIETVRGKLLDTLNKELPYSINVSIRFWEVDSSETLNVVIVLDCKKKFTARVVVGSGGRNIIQLAKEIEQDLRNTFRQEVRLRLVVQPDL